MRRHSRSIALASLFILLLTGLAYADDIICGETLTRLIDDRGVEDDLTFTALQGEVVSVTVAAAAGQPFKFDPQWQITDSDGHKVPLANDDTRCGSTEHQCETLRFEASDTYTLSVRDDNHNAAGIYNVTLEAVSATANGALNGPPAQVPACARLNQSGKPDGTQLIERGQLVGGAIDAFGETDTFTFAAAAGDVVTIGLATGGSPADSFDPAWKLFDPNGAIVGGGDQGIVYCTDSCDRGPLPATGIYTIKVYDFGYDGAGDYTLLLQNTAVTTTTTVTTTTETPASTTTTLLPAGTAPIYELAKTLRRPRDLGPAEELGAALAATPDRLIIGSPADETSGPAAGAVFVLSLFGNPGDASYGQLLATLVKPSGPSAKGDRFGAALALIDQSILVGAPGDDTKGEDAGAAYIFGADFRFALRDPLTSPLGAAGGRFGAAVAVLDGQALVGAPGEDGVGRVYLFSAAGGLIQSFDAAKAVAGAVDVQNANAATPRAGDRFGAAIAASGDEIVFGAPADVNNPGRVFLFNSQTGKWRVIASPSPSPGDGFGSAVTFAGNAQIVIGAPGVGKVFVVGQQRGKPAQDAELAPSGGLGAAVAAFGSNQLLVGAPTDGAATGGTALQVQLDNNPSKDEILTKFAKQLPEVGDGYGTAVVAAGSRIAIGSPGDNAGTVDGGAVYVYGPTSTTPEAVFRKRLTPSGFGKALSANATDVVVGAPDDAEGHGAVYRFDTRIPCTPNCPLLGSPVAGPVAGSRFGQAVAVLDGTALVGAPSQDGAQGEASGSAFLVNPTQVGPLLADPEPFPGDQFGFAVAAADNDLLVGAPLLGSTDTGAVFVFDQSDGFPRRVTYRKPTPTAGDFFGAAIAVDGDTVAIGAPFDNTAAQNGGAVYLFRRSTAELLRPDPLVSNAPVARELFGSALAISAQWIVVGAPLQDGNNDAPGKAYVFDRTTLALVRTLDSPSPHPGDRFGAAVAIVGGYVLVGAPYEDSGGATDSGVAYLFEPASGNLAQVFNNPAQNAFDRFGQSLVAGPAGPVIGAPGPSRVYVYQSASGGLTLRNARGITAAASGPRCGNGIVEGAEQCDDGNSIDTDDCRNDCTLQKCCTIDPHAADRCNDFDPCTDDVLDPSGGCRNIDNGTCCTSDASCAGDGTCRLCAGCSLFPWDCCDEGAACILKSPECSDKQCFDAATCECQGGLTCSDGAVPTEISSLFVPACDMLRLEQDGSSDRTPLQVARTAAKEARKMLRKAMRRTREQLSRHAICRKEILTTLRQVRRSIPEGQRMRKCVAQEQSGA
jgi:cysteine-rich repeat protein